jgi:hypothetical protein
MAAKFRIGDHVIWRWGAYAAEGIVDEVFTTRVERLIKTSRIVRNATADEPAYLVRQASGATALKSQRELTKA